MTHFYLLTNFIEHFYSIQRDLSYSFSVSVNQPTVFHRRYTGIKCMVLFFTSFWFYYYRPL